MTDDFDKLQQQYFDATIDERNRLWPDFIRAIRETYPGFLEEVEHKFRNGDYLMAMFGQCMKRVLARPDLNAGRKTNAQEDATVFMAAFDELQQVDPHARGLAYELATRALFTALRVGLNPDEVENLRAEARSEWGGRAGRRADPPAKQRGPFGRRTRLSSQWRLTLATRMPRTKRSQTRSRTVGSSKLRSAQDTGHLRNSSPS